MLLNVMTVIVSHDAPNGSVYSINAIQDVTHRSRITHPTDAVCVRSSYVAWMPHHELDRSCVFADTASRSWRTHGFDRMATAVRLAVPDTRSLSKRFCVMKDAMYRLLLLRELCLQNFLLSLLLGIWD